MSKWIDADALMKRVEDSNKSAGLHLEDLRKIRRWINTAPSIDIVRCKECKHWEMRNSPRGWCVVHQGYVSPQYFCADGERRTDD